MDTETELPQRPQILGNTLSKVLSEQKNGPEKRKKQQFKVKIKKILEFTKCDLRILNGIDIWFHWQTVYF